MPAEVRNRIYELAMDTFDAHLHVDYPSWNRLSFSRTCHQIFAETAFRYFALKLLPVSDALHTYCPMLGELRVARYLVASQLRAVRQIVADWTLLLYKDADWRGLRRLTGLKKLVLWDGPNKMTRGVWARLAELREYIGKEDLEIELGEGDCVFD
jgi:hypothetical protein